MKQKTIKYENMGKEALKCLRERNKTWVKMDKLKDLYFSAIEKEDLLGIEFMQSLIKNGILTKEEQKQITGWTNDRTTEEITFQVFGEETEEAEKKKE